MKIKKIMIPFLAVLLMTSCKENTNTSSSNNISNMFEGYIYDQFLTISNLDVEINKNYYLSKNLHPTLSWSSLKILVADESILTVDTNNNILAKKEGTTDIYIYDEDRKIVQKLPVNIQSYEEISDSYTINVGRFYNSEVSFFGDSITQYWGNDNYYVKFLADDLEVSTYYNLGVSGATAAISEVRDPSNSNIGPKHVDDAIANNKIGEYAFILFGTNDWSGYVPMGTVDDNPSNVNDCTTFYGGLNYMINKLKASRDDIKITIMTCLNRAMIRDNNPNNLGEEHDLLEYNDAIKNVAEKHNIKLIDLFPLVTTENFGTFLSDGLHPSEYGHRQMADYILKQ